MANPVPHLNTKSKISGPQGQSNTNVALSTFIIIQVNGNPVGAVQELSVNENRNIQMVDEVGTDGHIDSAPNKSTDIEGDCKRIRFNLMRVAPAFGRDFIHVSSQRLPFDLTIIDSWNGSGSNAIITTIENVWISKISYSYRKDDWLIVDDMSWKAERISSTYNSGPAATTLGGTVGFPLQLDNIEQSADQGLTIGSLSVGGLINEFFQ